MTYGATPNELIGFVQSAALRPSMWGTEEWSDFRTFFFGVLTGAGLMGPFKVWLEDTAAAGAKSTGFLGLDLPDLDALPEKERPTAIADYFQTFLEQKT